jgi:hypothetical protein
MMTFLDGKHKMKKGTYVKKKYYILHNIINYQTDNTKII